MITSATLLFILGEKRNISKSTVPRDKHNRHIVLMPDPVNNISVILTPNKIEGDSFKMHCTYLYR